MKRAFAILAGFGFVTALLLVSHAALATDSKPSAELGKQLFDGPSLGTNGKSCSTCHQSERKLGVLASKSSWFGGNAKTLEQAINICIQSTLKGKALPEDSVEIQSIALYMRSFIKR
jgi:cytochrome c peroxidase